MSNEGSEVAVIYMQRNAVVTIQCMKDGRFCAVWDRVYLVELGLRVVGLTCGMRVKGLEIYCPPWVTILFEQTTIQWHQVTGSPIGTGSITPRQTS